MNLRRAPGGDTERTIEDPGLDRRPVPFLDRILRGLFYSMRNTNKHERFVLRKHRGSGRFGR